MSDLTSEKKYNKWIWILSIVIPIAVAVLFTVKIPNVEPLSFLPPIYAMTNAITAILLVLAVIMIKKGKRKMHELFMKSAIVLSVLFLLMYIAYHMTSESTSYGGEGMLQYVYYFILLTHIVLSIVVIPFVLITYVRAISGNFERHKKIARITFPLWLYVAITGVIVYIMIAPYY
ncbi:MAG: putative membrane protein [Candidatus Latescibacterota bacterium]|jgi:putative membrane protein